jgi:Fe-S cluster assembly ATP-binding protein
MKLLAVKNLKVSVGGVEVVRNASLEVGRDEALYILGPNGSGKTSLIKAIIGYPGYEITEGKILFEDKDVTNYTLEDRVKLGLGTAYQFPPKIVGVKVGQLIKFLLKKRNALDMYDYIIKVLNIGHLIDRDFNCGFSGGEMKRVEIAMLLAQMPKLALIDEPDSGVDVESVMYIAEGIREFIKNSPHKSVIVVTHSGLISKYVKPTKVCIMVEGIIKRCGSSELLHEVLERGFRFAKS